MKQLLTLALLTRDAKLINALMKLGDGEMAVMIMIPLRHHIGNAKVPPYNIIADPRVEVLEID